MVSFYKYLLPAMWAAWVVYWGVAAKGVKASTRREPMGSRLLHVVPLLVAAALLVPERSPFPVLGERFLSDVKAGRRPARAPVYSHLIYDVVPHQWVEVDRPDILVVEGLNVLQTGRLPKDGKAIPFVSDFFDFSVYIDADEDVLKAWYVDRFLTLRGTAFSDPKSYFHRYASLTDQEAIATASGIWTSINLVNLHENILPTRQRSDLILKKGANHIINEVALRKL